MRCGIGPPYSAPTTRLVAIGNGLGIGTHGPRRGHPDVEFIMIPSLAFLLGPAYGGNDQVRAEPRHASTTLHPQVAPRRHHRRWHAPVDHRGTREGAGPRAERLRGDRASPASRVGTS